MCAMDRVAHFPRGQLAPPPMGQKATPTAKEVANGVKRCLSIGSAPEAQGPMSVCQQRDLATKKGVETLPRRVKNLPHRNIRCSRALRMSLMAHFYFIWTVE
jgi:hypothetical protein